MYARAGITLTCEPRYAWALGGGPPAGNNYAVHATTELVTPLEIVIHIMGLNKYER